MAQILTYPHGIKYQFSGWANQVKQGTGGSIPCNNVVYEGKRVVTTNNTEWWGDNTGNTNYSFSSSQPQNNPFNQNQDGSGQKGLHYWVQTSSKGFRKARWFDIGDEGGKNHGDAVSSTARSSWLREVTAVWFLVNGHDTTTTRGCYGHIEKVAIRYRDAYGKVAIHKCTEKLGNLNIEADGWSGVRGPNKELFGYALPSSIRSTICNNNNRFLGIRVQILLRRDEGGVSTDTLQCGISGIRLGLGTNPTGSYNETAKRALVLAGNTTWSDFSNSSIKDKLETR